MEQIISEFWPLISAVVVGAVGYGKLHNDVTSLKGERAAAEEDHDRLIRLEAQHAVLDKKVSEIQGDVKELLRRVR